MEPYMPTGPGTANPTAFAPNLQKDVRVYINEWTRYIFEVQISQPPAAFTEWNEYVRVLHNDPTLTLSVNQRDIAWNAGPGNWRMLSSWVIREDGSISRVVFRVPLGWYTGQGRDNHLSGMRFTMDSSKHGTIGDMTGYTRNVVVLKNYDLPTVPESDTFLFRPPVR
jgi:hypothetical protein